MTVPTPMTPDDPPLGAGDLLGNAGPPPAVTAGGVTYRLARPDPGVIADVENRLLDSAYEEVDAALGRAATDAQRERLRRRVEALDERYFVRGEHKCGRPAWEEAFATPRGLVLIVWACVRRHRPEFTEADAGRLAAAHPAAWARAVAHVMAPFAEAVGVALGATPERAAAAVRAAAAEQGPRIGAALAALAAAEGEPPPPT